MAPGLQQILQGLYETAVFASLLFSSVNTYKICQTTLPLPQNTFTIYMMLGCLFNCRIRTRVVRETEVPFCLGRSICSSPVGEGFLVARAWPVLSLGTLHYFYSLMWLEDVESTHFLKQVWRRKFRTLRDLLHRALAGYHIAKIELQQPLHA